MLEDSALDLAHEWQGLWLREHLCLSWILGQALSIPELSCCISALGPVTKLLTLPCDIVSCA